MNPELVTSLQKELPKSVLLTAGPEENKVTLLIGEPHQRLQTDSGAFEAWVFFVHKASPRTKIQLQIPQLSRHQIESTNFKRFLYRAANFSGWGYSWFSLEPGLLVMTEEFMAEYQTHQKTIRLPRSEAGGQSDKGEKILQNKFSGPESILLALPECENAALHTELPIDLFWGGKRSNIKPENRVFSSGSDCLDLWCVKEDALNLFVLKYQKLRASIVSELFYFACCCRDIFIKAQENQIVFPARPSTVYRGFGDFYDSEGAVRPLTAINAWFLADKFHPALDLEFICEMLTTKTMVFQVLRYSCEMPMAFELT